MQTCHFADSRHYETIVYTTILRLPAGSQRQPIKFALFNVQNCSDFANSKLMVSNVCTQKTTLFLTQNKHKLRLKTFGHFCNLPAQHIILKLMQMGMWIQQRRA